MKVLITGGSGFLGINFIIFKFKNYLNIYGLYF